jgi:hypothetical protein
VRMAGLAPHSALGVQPPTDYRASLELTPPSVWDIAEQTKTLAFPFGPSRTSIVPNRRCTSLGE